jgi:hypothetical protein
MANKENRAAKVKAREKANKAKKIQQSKKPWVEASDDNEFIIGRLQELGVWEAFQARIQASPGHNIELTLGLMFFVYVSGDDGGFVFFECENEKSLAAVISSWDTSVRTK